MSTNIEEQIGKAKEEQERVVKLRRGTLHLMVAFVVALMIFLPCKKPLNEKKVAASASISK